MSGVHTNDEHDHPGRCLCSKHQVQLVDDRIDREGPHHYAEHCPDPTHNVMHKAYEQTDAHATLYTFKHTQWIDGEGLYYDDDGSFHTRKETHSYTDRYFHIHAHIHTTQTPTQC